MISTMNEKVTKGFFLAIGLLATALGFTGLFLPLMPTTCFLILAVWAFSKSNPEWSNWLLEHPDFGPTIKNWMKYKSIDRKMKCKISLSIVIGFSVSLLLLSPGSFLSIALLSVMIMLLFYINTRAEPGNNYNKIDLSYLNTETGK